MSKFNGLVRRSDMIAGSQTDMTIAYVLRGVMIILLASLVYCFINMRDDLHDIKRDWPQLQKDVSDLKDHAATKKELEAAEIRVKNEFAEQLKKATTATTSR